MGKADDYFTKHVSCAIGIHFFSGLGIAWLLSLIWHYSVISLVLGIVFTVVGIAGRVYAQLAKP
jgi:hypothetical protein